MKSDIELTPPSVKHIIMLKVDQTEESEEEWIK